MRDALAYTVVHCDERPLCLKRALHGAAKPLGIAEDCGELFGGQVDYRFAVRARNDEDVAGEQRARIEEGDACFVLDHAVGRDLAGGNCAERARARRHFRGSLLRAAAPR
jgi:hypothetical protein